MSVKLVEEINKFSSFRFDKDSNIILNTKGVAKADIEQFLELSHLLDSNFISYEMTTTFDLKIIGKR